MHNGRNNKGLATRRDGKRTRRAVGVRCPERQRACTLALISMVLLAVAFVILDGKESERSFSANATLTPFLTITVVKSDITPGQRVIQSSNQNNTSARLSRVRALPETYSAYPVVAMLSIDKLGLELSVLGENNDAALEISPCLYAGPDSPEFEGNIVITGHNYKNESHFGRLDEMKNGDTITYTDKWGGVYCYEVYDRETIAPNQIDALEKYEGERALSLLTCTQSGKKRLLVRCRLIDEDDEAC